MTIHLVCCLSVSQTPTHVASATPASTQATLGGLGAVQGKPGRRRMASRCHDTLWGAGRGQGGALQIKKQRGVQAVVPSRAPRTRGHRPSLMNKSGVTYLSSEHTGSILLRRSSHTVRFILLREVRVSKPCFLEDGRVLCNQGPCGPLRFGAAPAHPPSFPGAGQNLGLLTVCTSFHPREPRQVWRLPAPLPTPPLKGWQGPELMYGLRTK